MFIKYGLIFKFLVLLDFRKGFATNPCGNLQSQYMHGILGTFHSCSFILYQEILCIMSFLICTGAQQRILICTGALQRRRVKNWCSRSSSCRMCTITKNPCRRYSKGLRASLQRTAMMLNTELSLELLRLNNTLPGSRIVYVDIYTPLLDMILRPFAYNQL